MSGKQVRIINDNFRQGYGMEGEIVDETGELCVFQYEDEGEIFQWVLKKEDFEEIE